MGEIFPSVSNPCRSGGERNLPRIAPCSIPANRHRGPQYTTHVTVSVVNTREVSNIWPDLCRLLAVEINFAYDHVYTVYHNALVWSQSTLHTVQLVSQPEAQIQYFFVFLLQFERGAATYPQLANSTVACNLVSNEITRMCLVLVFVFTNADAVFLLDNKNTEIYI